jgi:hypothetical protein
LPSAVLRQRNTPAAGIVATGRPVHIGRPHHDPDDVRDDFGVCPAQRIGGGDVPIGWQIDFLLGTSRQP